MSLKRLVFGACVVAIVIAAASCREPTQVVIEARTNIVHQPGFVTSFTVGPHASLEGTAPTTETREPWGADGFVGSLVVVPGGASDASLTVKLVLGVRRDARECEPPTYAGCIVARRKLRYAPNERLRLPITLYAQCENVPCDAESTCNFLGQCVSATVDQRSCEMDDGCTVEGDRPPTIPRPGEDADVGSDSASEAASDVAVTSDAAPESDASSDATNDTSSDAGMPGQIKCPPTTCTQPSKCCNNGGSASFCVPKNAACLQPSVEVNCDGREDCAVGETCCVQNEGFARCAFTLCVGIGYYELCHTTSDCSGGRQCDQNLLWASTYPTCK